mgnify:FL=1
MLMTTLCVLHWQHGYASSRVYQCVLMPLYTQCYYNSCVVCVLLEATMCTIGYNLCICLYMHVCVVATVYEM